MARATLLGLLAAGCLGVPEGAAPDGGQGADAASGVGPSGVPADESLMLLPWAAHERHPCTQQHQSGSHVGEGAWAWDFGMPVGTPVLAAHAGVVRVARGDVRVGGCDPAYANDVNHVVLDRGDGTESLYLHLDAVVVAEGQRVRRGELLGRSGQTGWACGAHLHFQVQDVGVPGDWYNASRPEVFHDTGQAWDPPAGVELESMNAPASAATAR